MPFITEKSFTLPPLTFMLPFPFSEGSSGLIPGSSPPLILSSQAALPSMLRATGTSTRMVEKVS
jgi:hypothetical protein